MITKGITSIVADCFSDISVEEAKKIKLKENFMSFNITQLLTFLLKYGLSNLIETIRSKVALL